MDFHLKTDEDKDVTLKEHAGKHFFCCFPLTVPVVASVVFAHPTTTPLQSNTDHLCVLLTPAILFASSSIKNFFWPPSYHSAQPE